MRNGGPGDPRHLALSTSLWRMKGTDLRAHLFPSLNGLEAGCVFTEWVKGTDRISIQKPQAAGFPGERQGLMGQGC